jgi:hypothetical protein
VDHVRPGTGAQPPNIDRKVTVHLTGDTMVVFDNRREIARHVRLAGRGLEHLAISSTPT